MKRSKIYTQTEIYASKKNSSVEKKLPKNLHFNFFKKAILTYLTEKQERSLYKEACFLIVAKKRYIEKKTNQ